MNTDSSSHHPENVSKENPIQEPLSSPSETKSIKVDMPLEHRFPIRIGRKTILLYQALRVVYLAALLLFAYLRLFQKTLPENYLYIVAGVAGLAGFVALFLKKQRSLDLVWQLIFAIIVSVLLALTLGESGVVIVFLGAALLF